MSSRQKNPVAGKKFRITFRDGSVKNLVRVADILRVATGLRDSLSPEISGKAMVALEGKDKAVCFLKEKLIKAKIFEVEEVL